MGCETKRGADMRSKPTRIQLLKTLLSVSLFIIIAFHSTASIGTEKNSGSAADAFFIAQLHYGGGGDWYENRTSMVRLQARLTKEFGMAAGAERKVVKIMDEELFSYPMIFMTGHGNVIFTQEEATRLRKYFDAGGFLWISDDYGMNDSLRREFEKVFPGQQFAEVPFDHPIYGKPYVFKTGLPKIHEHAGGQPHGYALHTNGRMSVFYDFNTDIGDGLEAPEIHGDPADIREKAFQMGVNIAFFAFTQ